MYENTITSPDETSLSEKFPLKSVFVPLVVFFTMTLTPGSDSFELASVTEPVNEPVWAVISMHPKKNRMLKIRLFIKLLFFIDINLIHFSIEKIYKNYTV